MAEVSIIVPVYNVEKYLSFCLDSLVNQTFKDIEIICVNDGSTDTSPVILEHYARLDKRIKIINKSNGGLSSARNAGMDAAGGKYLSFVDADDFVSHFLVEKARDFIKIGRADFVSFMFYSVIGKPLKMLKHYISFDKAIDGKVITETELPGRFYSEIHPTAWCKFYSSSLINENGLRFKENMIFEDLPFAAEVYLLAKRMVFTNMTPYFYRVLREGSILDKKDAKDLDLVKSFSYVDKIFKEHYKFEKYKNALMHFNMILAVHDFSKINPEHREKFFYALKDYFSKFDFRAYDGKALEKSKNYRIISLILSCNYSAFCKAVKNYV